jgi:hypothetical protein
VFDALYICEENVHIVAVEERLNLRVNGLLVGQLREATHVQPSAVFAVALEVGRSVVALPAIKGN